MNKLRFCILLLVAGCALTDASSTNDNADSAFMRVYNRSGSYLDFSLSNAEQVVSHLNLNKLTIMYIHGHAENVVTNGVTPIINDLLKYSADNIIALDYRNISTLSYPLAVAELPALGVKVAKSIEKIVEAGVKAESIHVIGHSLGAQLSGHIGRNLKFKLTRITGLDPAGPLYYVENAHLSASDAKFVDIIHTDAGVLGLAAPTGTVDFYPNGGHGPQPGCPVSIALNEVALCSHHRSWKFYLASLKKKNAFIGVKCSNELSYDAGLCNGNEKAVMGYNVSPETKGVYYLRTGADEPYGLGEAGAQSA